jgi:hypothetical protein
MIIPKQIKIHGIWYTVELVSGLRADDDCSGRILPTKAKILLDDSMCADITKAVLIHEVLEVIKEENQLKMPHRSLQTMATQLYGVIQNNNEVFQNDDLD